ncbi:MAG: crossover junction endodeoxyribonuclease RuvC [Candidatus Abyssobacteria bacterium SURF_17]|jgi:crossover junction endodeoxyribonuclease RuvC|uniref:Crossover junction endodeoxyribonuclease RuvC n=1 Tax=Candidatus Abyssobacteria bacterium SURF_17 TaxID=2093361 RepID=A0A419F672_9BACT|nr:MAG: crossover junction endodeoxyribonuclease RuvC [Candidatus Abyssubacteria bacterium SURF_17]
MGVDPGLSATGYGIINVAERQPLLVEAGVLRSRDKDPLETRLLEIHRGMTEVIREFAPTVVVVEELYSKYAHPRTAILMGHARGVVCVTAAQAGIPVVSYASTRIKNSLAGHGRASKEQVQRMVQHVFGLRQAPHPPDVADALAVALCHHNVLMHGCLSSPPVKSTAQ